ncbi:hypothetical protein EYZ11_011476 [Aspergillus tanneri]|uniref:Uncharacterized protein n=1 Tax=Aspergillus tanneri TaxID=1220188 RepID=A0A4S3J320_9EURO|nr:hypothetical protein EYZ11_011476 [Aspergillus tanneri]
MACAEPLSASTSFLTHLKPVAGNTIRLLKNGAYADLQGLAVKLTTEFTGYCSFYKAATGNNVRLYIEFNG